MVDLVPFIYFCVLPQRNPIIFMLITVFTRQDMGAIFCSCALTLLSCRITDDPICSGSNIGEINVNRLLQCEVSYFGTSILEPERHTSRTLFFPFKTSRSQTNQFLVVSSELSLT